LSSAGCDGERTPWRLITITMRRSDAFAAGATAPSERLKIKIRIAVRIAVNGDLSSRKRCFADYSVRE
jgi:hypothetical protein